jgi:hypothetical protein
VIGNFRPNLLLLWEDYMLAPLHCSGPVSLTRSTEFFACVQTRKDGPSCQCHLSQINTIQWFWGHDQAGALEEKLYLDINSHLCFRFPRRVLKNQEKILDRCLLKTRLVIKWWYHSVDHLTFNIQVNEESLPNLVFPCFLQVAWYNIG